MHRVLSFQMGMAPPRGFGEPSEFVTKRMCFSFIFFISFLALLGGFLLGKFVTERNFEKRLNGNHSRSPEHGPDVGTGSADLLHHSLLLEELQKTFSTPSRLVEPSKNNTLNNDDFTDLEVVKRVLSNLHLFKNVVEKRSSIVATLRGSLEPDRWVVLSLSGDGTRLGIDLARTLVNLRLNHNWEPQRTIVFCFFDQPRDPCADNLSEYLKSRIVAYLAVHGKALQKKGCFVASGSEIAGSMVLQVRDTLISASNSDLRRVFDDCEIEGASKGQILMPRLATDLPHASISFKSENATNTELSNESEMQSYRRILTQIIGLSIWKFSKTVIFVWDPNDFERNVETALKMINSSHFSGVKDQITSTMRELVIGAKNFDQRITDVKIPSSQLAIRMTNDLLMDLDRALLCPDADFRSKTDPASIPGLLTQSRNRISTFLENMLKCYKDAVEVLRDG